MISSPTLLDWPVSTQVNPPFLLSILSLVFLAKEQAADIEHLVDHFTNLHLGGMCFIGYM